MGNFLFGLGFTDLFFQKQVGTPIPIPRIEPIETAFALGYSSYR